MIFLPGTDQQIKFLLDSVDINLKKILVIGPGTIKIARIISENGASPVLIIVDDYESLIGMRDEAEKDKDNINVRMMDFDNTDFKPATFDIIYAQGSVSGTGRNKIVKEIRKILKDDGTFCAGEIVSLEANPPAFIRDIWESSSLLPLENDKTGQYYQGKGFEIINEKDLSFTLRDFYRQSENYSSTNFNGMREEEIPYHKKLLKKFSHESNAYLNLGGKNYMGFKALIMRKNQV